VVAVLHQQVERLVRAGRYQAYDRQGELRFGGSELIGLGPCRQQDGEAASRNNQAHLRDKSSAGQSLSVALLAPCAQLDCDPGDRDGAEETLTKAQAIAASWNVG
jgi:hypothetical protein